MPTPERIAYVLKRYPRFSETFVVSEILAHEAAGTDIDIFALRPPTDTRFQPEIARVRGEVTYLQSAGIRAGFLWTLLQPYLEDRDDRIFDLAGALDTSGEEVSQALQLAAAIRTRAITHIHAHFGTSATTVARLASLLTGVPYTFTAHAKDIFHEYVEADALDQKIADAASVVTVSDYNVAHLSREYPQHAHKIARIYNGISLEKYPLRGAATPEPLILAVGRLVEKKGFNHLITACHLLRREGLRFRCEIIGSGEFGDRLHQQIDELALHDVIELTGSRPTDLVAARMRDAALLVVPCITASTGDRDGLPTVLLEAMASGTPCVGTTVTGIPEVIRHEVTGLLVPEQQPAELARSMQRLLHDPALGRELAMAARQLIESNFDIQRNARRLRELWGQAAAPSAPSLQEAV